jgi:transcriptional regulator with GAF, ATPase, and Fis domain
VTDDSSTTAPPRKLVDHGMQAELAEVFVTLADTLVDDYDVVELMEHLTQTCVDVLGATAAGLMISDQRGSLQVIAASSQEVHLLELFQIQSDEGPCLDCVLGGSAVIVEDLSKETTRWPAFTPAAQAANFQAVHAVPLRLRSDILGAMNLFFDEPVGLNARDRRVAQALADVATIGVLQQRAVHRASVVAEQLQRALNSRVVIEQAKGMLAQHMQRGMDEAFAALRGYARNHNRKLTDLAMALSTGEVQPAEIAKP